MAAAQVHKALVFLIGNEDMRRLFDDWPGQMQLAVCLKEDGDCRLLVHREEEGAAFLPRLRKTLALPVKDICFFPEIEGYPTRKILYSEEKQLFGLVKASPEIVEEAADYSINYTFALDEGLDPTRFMKENTPLPANRSQKPLKRQIVARPIRRTAPAVETSRPAKDRSQPKPTTPPQGAPRKSSAQPKTQGSLPRFMQAAPAQEPGPAFQSLDQIRVDNPLPATCTIHAERAGWIGIELPGCIGGTVAVSNPGNIFVRDDRRVVAIQSEMIGRESGPLPGHISLGVKYLPDGLREIFARSAGAADLSFENGFLFITLRASAHRPATSELAANPFHRLRSYWRIWASAAAVGAILVMGLQFFTGPRVLSDAETIIDWSEFQSGALDDAALDAELTRALLRLDG